MVLRKIGRRGALLTFLLWVVLFLIAAGFSWLWYQEHEEEVGRWIGLPKRGKAYVTYEEHLKRQEKEKALRNSKNNIAEFFHRLTGRP